MLRRILNYIVYTNLIVSLSASLLCTGLLSYLGLTSVNRYGVFIFFATLFVYNFQRLVKTRSNESKWLYWVNEHLPLVLIICTISSIITVIWFIVKFDASLVILGVIGFAGVISVLYVLKLGKTNLRDIPHVKIYLIAFVWAVMIVLFPLMNEGQLEGNIHLFILHFLYILAVTIPFDIRDLKYDHDYHKTIPQLVGVLGAKIIGVGLLVIFAAGMFYFDASFISNPYFYVALVTQMLLIVFMTVKRSDLYCAGFIDGAIALLGLSYWMN